MEPVPHKADSSDGSPWLGVIKVVWILCLTVGSFFIAHSMVQHDFFSGGALDYRSTSTPDSSH